MNRFNHTVGGRNNKNNIVCHFSAAAGTQAPRSPNNTGTRGLPFTARFCNRAARKRAEPERHPHRRP